MSVRSRKPKFELENFPPGRFFGPAIDQFKQAVIDPNARPHFLVDPERRERPVEDSSAATLKRWRYEGTGPEYVEIEGRFRYDVRVLLDYIKRNTRVPSVRAAMEETRGAA